jgi:hypothetical protein
MAETLNTQENGNNANTVLGTVLHLTLKKKWFDMILSGIKKEEYRELNSYWGNRLTKLINFQYIEGMEDLFKDNRMFFKQFDYIHFYNGGSPCLKYPNFLIESKGIDIGTAVPEWSDNLKGKTFRLKLGAILHSA